MNWYIVVKDKTSEDMEFKDVRKIQDELLKDGVSSFIWRVK